jgi:hypothetical protein
VGFPVHGLAVVVAVEGYVASCTSGELVGESCWRAAGSAIADEEGTGSAGAVCEGDHNLAVECGKWGLDKLSVVEADGEKSVIVVVVFRVLKGWGLPQR